MAYQLEGRLLEVCTCNILCPCWVGEDPDNGTCDGLLSWMVDKGTVKGVDVTGRCITLLCHIPGNILKGNWKVRVYVDDGASDEQKQGLLDVWTGKLGGPVADLAQLVGEVVSVEQVPITFDVQGVNGTIKVGPKFLSIDSLRSRGCPWMRAPRGSASPGRRSRGGAGLRKPPPFLPDFRPDLVRLMTPAQVQWPGSEITCLLGRGESARKSSRWIPAPARRWRPPF